MPRVSINIGVQPVNLSVVTYRLCRFAHVRQDGELFSRAFVIEESVPNARDAGAPVGRSRYAEQIAQVR